MIRLSSKPVLKAVTFLLALLFMAKTGTATTAVMVTDEMLISSSRVILIGEVKSQKAQWDASRENIYTYVKVQVSKVLKGQIQGEQIVFKQLGGTVGDESTIIFGTPGYKIGQQVLLFLDTARDGTLRVAHLFQGKYDIVTDERTGRARVERLVDKDSVNILGLQEGPEFTSKASLSRFVKKIKATLRDRAEDVATYDEKYEGVAVVEIPSEYVDEPGDQSAGDVTPHYTFLGSGYRWFQPDTGQPVSYRVNPTGSPTPNGGNNEINLGLAAWTNVQTTALVLQNAGSTTAVGFQADGVSAISYNDPLDQMQDPVGCGGTLAIGGVSSAGGGSIVIGGITFGRIQEGDVVFNRNFQCFLGISANLAEVACHEVGHSIGFGHSGDGAAIMAPTAHGQGRGATLGSDDIAAVSFLYPGSKSTPPPTVPNVPTSLSAVAASSSSINLTWVDASNNETGFKLERKTGATGTYSEIAQPSAGQIGYSDSGLQASTTYYYRIRAYNAAGNSAYSTEAFATTSSAPTPTNNASFVSQSAPSTMTAGQSASVSVTMQNTGTTTWSAGAYKLGSQNPQDNNTWGLNRVNLASSVAPGGQAAFTFNITAPAAAGSYNFQWRMLQDGIGFFGSSSMNVSVTVSSGGGGGGADNAAFVLQVMPSVMSPGQLYSATVTMRNTGTTTWLGSTGYKLGSQNPQDNNTWGLNRVNPATSIAPGQSATFKFIVRAPSTDGTYNFQWRMVKEGTGFFGSPSQNIAVQVGSGGGGGGGTNDASFVSQSAPSTMTAGQSAAVSVTMQNTGTTTWSAGTYKLGSQNPQDNNTWGLNRVNLASSVAPGGQATFTFNVTAPATAGSYNFQWRMLQDGVGFFGSSSTNVAVTVSSGGGGGGTNNAAFVSQTVPATIGTGQSAAVSVTMQNNGTTTWSAGTYKLGSQNPQGNITWGLNEISLPISVAPGAQATFTFNITAPGTAGTYNFQWRMLQAGVGAFGVSTTNVPVSVSAGATPLFITTVSLASGLRNTFYSQQLTATGGSAPYLWSVTSGALPAGLSLNSSTGVISGTPVTGGGFIFTVTVRDQNNVTSNKPFKISVR